MKCDRCPVEVYAESRKRLVKVWNARATPAPSAMRPEVAKLVEAANMALDLGSLMDSPPDREFQVPRRCYLALDAALVALRAKGDA